MGAPSGSAVPLDTNMAPHTAAKTTCARMGKIDEERRLIDMALPLSQEGNLKKGRPFRGPVPSAKCFPRRQSFFPLIPVLAGPCVLGIVLG